MQCFIFIFAFFLQNCCVPRHLTVGFSMCEFLKR